MIKHEWFTKLSEHAQEVLKTWAEENFMEYDWFYILDEADFIHISEVKDTRGDNVDVGRVFYLGQCLCWSSIYEPNLVPLFSLEHLIKFIEEKTEGKIDFAYYNLTDKGHKGYTIELWSEECQRIKEYKDLGHDILKAAWEVASQIAENEKVEG